MDVLFEEAVEHIYNIYIMCHEMDFAMSGVMGIQQVENLSDFRIEHLAGGNFLECVVVMAAYGGITSRLMIVLKQGGQALMVLICSFACLWIIAVCCG